MERKDNSESLDQVIKEQDNILEELEYIKDEKEKFWKTPSSSRMVRGGTMMISFDIISSIFFSIYIMQIFL